MSTAAIKPVPKMMPTLLALAAQAADGEISEEQFERDSHVLLYGTTEEVREWHERRNR